MKTIKLIPAIIILCLTVLITNAQTPTYKHGTVWAVSMVHTKANMETEYLNSLKGTWKAMMDEAVKQGLIVSYKILEGSYSNEEDYNIMLMVEHKDFNSTGDMNSEKWDALYKSVIGGDDKRKTINDSRVSVREILGDKLMSEIIFK